MLSCIFILKPLKNGANFTGGQRNARLRRAIIQMCGVANGGKGDVTGKDDVARIPTPTAGFRRAKDPLITAS